MSEAQAQPKPKPMFQVFDMLQRGKDPRKHDIITKFYPKEENGHQPDPETQTYALFSDVGCEMEMAHAMKFLIDPAFRVIAPSGARIMPVQKLDISKPITNLADDEVVCNYAEMSKDALFRRVKVLPGSEDIAESAKHSDLVAFMVAWRKSLTAMSQGERALAEKMAGLPDLASTMTTEQLDNMFPARRIAA